MENLMTNKHMNIGFKPNLTISPRLTSTSSTLIWENVNLVMLFLSITIWRCLLPPSVLSRLLSLLFSRTMVSVGVSYTSTRSSHRTCIDVEVNLGSVDPEADFFEPLQKLLDQCRSAKVLSKCALSATPLRILLTLRTGN